MLYFIIASLVSPSPNAKPWYFVVSTPPILKNSQNLEESKNAQRNINKIKCRPKQKIFFKLFRVNLSDKEKETAEYGGSAIVFWKARIRALDKLQS